jgi:D-alanyl-D-alanine carboxypeptidase
VTNIDTFPNSDNATTLVTLAKSNIRYVELMIQRVLLGISLILLSTVPIYAGQSEVLIDVKTETVLFHRGQHDLHYPAGLGKLMTLYVAFDALQKQEITLDAKVTISPRAAAEPGIKLGLRPGSKIALHYLISAAAGYGANDAATAIAEAISGSEEKFVRRMKKTSSDLNLTSSNFQNPHGLTEQDYLVSAFDIAMLFIHIKKDFPNYFHYFEHGNIDVGLKTVEHAGLYLFTAIPEITAAKVGYTRASKYNAIVYAEINGKELVYTDLKNHSKAAQAARIRELLQLGSIISNRFNKP